MFKYVHIFINLENYIDLLNKKHKNAIIAGTVIAGDDGVSSENRNRALGEYGDSGGFVPT